MRMRIALALLLAAAFSAAGFAHGDKIHVMGLVEKVSADTITVKNAEGKSVDVKLAATTVYIFRDGKTKDGTPARVTDLAVGQRVIIHATPKGKDLVADEVKFAAAAPAAASKPTGN